MVNYYKAEVTITKRKKFFLNYEDTEPVISTWTFKDESISALMDKVLSKLEITYISEMEVVAETEEFTEFTYQNKLPRNIYEGYMNNQIPFMEKIYSVTISRVFELGVSLKVIENNCYQEESVAV